MKSSFYDVVFKGLSTSEVNPKLLDLFIKHFPSKSPEQIGRLLRENLRFVKNKTQADANKISEFINDNGGIASIVPSSVHDLKKTNVSNESSSSSDDVEVNELQKTTDALLSRVAKKVTDTAGIEKIEHFSIKELLSETFKKRSQEEVEMHCMVGTIATTPSLKTIDAGWPKPWLFIRLFVFMIIVYMTLLYSYGEWQNIIIVPGLIFIGSFAMPLTVLMFFFEMNAPNNVSLIVVSKSVLLGGAISLLTSLMIFDITEAFGWLGSSVAGLAEEPGKLIALLLITNASRYRYIHNGILLGAAVGAGFASFESMGYAFRVLLGSGSDSFLDNITVRGLLSPFAHIVWTAMIGGALWKVRQEKKFRWNMLRDARFLKIFFIAVGLHMIWNAPLILPFYTKYIILGFISWVVILGLQHEGLKQIAICKSASSL